MEQHLHIISFNIPYPPNYGGVIDVYYKIKALSELGVKIHLHCFEYGRKESKELSKLCYSVNYYRRDHSLRDFSSMTPYIVKTRKAPELLTNLLQDDYPILFEGLHTCYYLSAPEMKERLTIVRMHNVEADYYRGLGSNESNMFRKFYFYTESVKLKFYEKILKRADHILPISLSDFYYLNKNYPGVTYLPAFHPNEQVLCKPGKGRFVLYHGNLSVNENNQAAAFLISKVFNKTNQLLIIAGTNPSDLLVKMAKDKPNIQLRPNVSQQEMKELIEDAHIHILPTFQQTGIKLKLLNALYNGRFVIVNSQMIENTGLDELCIIREKAEEMRNTVTEFFNRNFDEKEIEKRKKVLEQFFSNRVNALKLIQLLYGSTQ